MFGGPMPATLESEDDKQMKFAQSKPNKTLNIVQYNLPP
jgi:hypothetical protein